MPGLNQLKKFNEDMKNIGDEVKLRAQRGEKPAVVPLPEGIPEADDSDAFIIGLPENPDAKDDDTPDAPATPSVDFSKTEDVLDVDSIIAGVLNETAQEESEPVEETPAAEETPLEDLDLESLLKTTGGVDDIDEDALAEFEDEVPAGNVDLNSDFEGTEPAISLNEDLPETILKNDGVDMSAESSLLANISDDIDLAPEELSDEPSAEPDSQSGAEALEMFDTSSLDDFTLPENSESAVQETPVEINETEVSDVTEEPAADFADFDTSVLNGVDFGGDAVSIDSKEPSDNDSGDTAGLADSVEDTVAVEPAVTEDSEVTFDTSALDNMNFDSAEDIPSEPASDTFDIGNLDIPSFDSGNDAASEPAADAEPFSMESIGTEVPASDSDGVASDDFAAFDTSGLDDMDFGGSGEAIDASQDVPGEEGAEDAGVFTDGIPDEVDMSQMENVDFSAPASSNSSDEFPVTGEGPGFADDFVLDNNFEIPGFSDTETADMGKKRPVLDTVDFSKGKSGLPKNSLTDDEYVQFKKNLANYPLNLRLAVEDFITNNEFTDDAVFEVIQKILKKNSARQVATQLEKLLDVAINIPRDYERRSFAQYEAYKQSFQYQLKNRIIPAAIIGVILAFVCFGLFRASVAFIYKPVMASMNYKQGYTLLENDEFPQSEEKFKEAVSYKPVKNWFLKYARGYRAKKQYERAGLMYRNTLGYFNHDKGAGLEYAEMELYDRANYERAEEIVRREVLDYHINDADGILLLGDVFLEWAELDESKYEDAKQEYLDLMQRYGENFLYLSRLLRYYIRTDKLLEVLTLKNTFYPNAKSLSADDWTELSGYLLEKLYGTLSRNDEYLRSSIEDVRAMLDFAIKANPANPVARYNLARYFVYNGYSDQAKNEFETSLELFDNLAVRTKKNVYKEINATRILGELYTDTLEYLKAQTVYTRGIDLFNEEHEKNGFEGDENTGKLFADMGDIDYFISGELDGALFNYEKAIATKNDTPSLNFRVGAIRYERQEYDKALASFIKVSETESKDPNLLLALGNVLSLRGDNFAARSYYSDLLKVLDGEKSRQKMLFPQNNEDDNKIVDMYLKANNNLGVTLYRLARQTGNSSMNAEAIVRLSDSIRAWDALTRNLNTMVRMEGSNLAAQNSKYITHPYPDFEPAIYTDIPKILSDEKVLE